MASTRPALDGGVPEEAPPADAGPAGSSADAGPPGDRPDAGSAGGSADAGALASGSDAGVDRYCDPSIDAAAGIVIVATSACAGVMPAAPTCAADVTSCAGWISSGTGGIFASAATSDALGAIAVACTSSDSGATLYRLGLATARYAATTQLGEAVAPLQDGFVATPLSRPAPVGIFAHDGTQLASIQTGGPAVIVAPGGVEILAAGKTSTGWTLTAQRFGDDGVARDAPQQLGELAASSGVTLAGAAEPGGAVLVTWSTYAPFATFARWLGADGTPLSPAFDISSWAGHAAASAALPGGGIAVGDTAGARWRGVLAPGSSSPSPVPAWLAARGDFTLVRGGAAALFGGAEVVAADGTSCGTLSFADGGSARAGADGTVFHATADGKGFRVYPQLLR